MPQASPELQAKFPGMDSEALDVLEANFHTRIHGFIIRPRVKGYDPTEREYDALDYLFHEWDWGYDPEPLTEK